MDKKQKYLIFFESPARRITNAAMQIYQDDTAKLERNERGLSLSRVIKRYYGNNSETELGEHRFVCGGIIVGVVLYVPSCFAIEYLDSTDTLGINIAAICCLFNGVLIILLTVRLLRNNISKTLLKRTFKEIKVMFVFGYCVFIIILACFDVQSNERYFANIINSFVYTVMVLCALILDCCTLRMRRLKLVVVMLLFVLNSIFVFERVFGETEKGVVFAKYLSITLMTRSLKRSAYFNINALIVDGLWCLLFDRKDEKMMFVRDEVLAET